MKEGKHEPLITKQARWVFDASIELEKRWRMLQNTAQQMHQEGRDATEVLELIDAGADTPDRKAAQSKLELGIAENSEKAQQTARMN